MIHEFGHEASGDHLSEEYHDALCVLGEDSVELCEASGVRLIAAGMDHMLNCEEGRRAFKEALCVVLAITAAL